MHHLQSLTNPERLWSRGEVLSRPSPVPATQGLYAWYFREPPESVPIKDTVRADDAALLYVGISPKNPVSRQTLRNRIRTHFGGNAEGSTLRLTLGTLLQSESGFPLRRVGSGKRMTFTHLGEQWLDSWMERNALVCWVEHPRPWEVEAEILRELPLPLNIQDNSHHPFAAELSRLRSTIKRNALSEAIASEGNQRRRMPHLG